MAVFAHELLTEDCVEYNFQANIPKNELREDLKEAADERGWVGEFLEAWEAEKPLFVFNFMDFVFIARDHMRMYLMATRPWICISTTKKACERSLVADDEEKS